ncbi:alpha/beta hydrolase [Aestuariibacter sp. GS-14]|uniref:alpha/beta hydrolase n=1 Tax=Aestuariibacter sp. GS-14 TaxID=2590670 RepID=UPI0011269D7E|nr:alpha/beta hydrolase [Aestuariibacter sp. GS-14]TPV59976.1 alpha/beta hydrolase [Aestuariibacter sp. GS-14]
MKYYALLISFKLFLLSFTPFASFAEASECDSAKELLQKFEQIPLRNEKLDTSGELVECIGESVILRNVTQATISPVLPEKNTTGLAVVVAPGGAFMMHSIMAEGYDVAEWLASKGISAFVLKYRLNPTPESHDDFRKLSREILGTGESLKQSDQQSEATPEALQDAQDAIAYIRQNAEKWGVKSDRIGIVGFSAGAMTALSVGDTQIALSKPDFIAPIYPPMSSRRVPSHAPPMFLSIALDDNYFAKDKPLELINSWRQAGIPIEAHLHQSGAHGYNLYDKNHSANLWRELFFAWLTDRGLTTTKIHYSVDKTVIGTLLDNPEARKILAKVIPNIVASDDKNNPQSNAMRQMTLSALKPYSQGSITEKHLKSIQKALDEL